ncbi:exonuclease [Exophiala viscosa]|uniref:Exonuclease n=1 Tax=Exophiala viscosa TaxID=2486360 RepID=A0AAN6E728_9EURO|nr:exonuclease [Exophiala viscosa]KAI1627388.1 exonuclease [Exophiala viscosa]
MSAGSKRSATEAGLSEVKLGQEQILHDLKTKRVSHQTSSSLPETPAMSSPKEKNGDVQRGNPGMPTPDAEWSVAESKSSRKKKRRKLREDPDSSPSINFLDLRPARVQLKALQDLVLYVTADGVAPTWLAVNNAKQIDKVVVLMVPGLDRATLENPKLFDYGISQDQTAAQEDIDGAANSYAQGQADAITSATIPTTNTPHTEDSETGSDTMARQESLRQRLLDHIIEVKAPGDSSTNRVHSPLQGMLIAPLSDSRKKDNSRDQKSFQSDRTPISTFVHTAEELREAEYPIHPAAFTSPVDAELEKSRRESTSQSASAGWVDTAVSSSEPTVTGTTPASQSRDSLTRGLKPYAIDCEMVLTTNDKYSLARISALDWHGKTVLDKYVKPDLPIKNYFTQFSGITPKHLENVTTTLADIQRHLLDLLGSDAILLGHSLESDLNALQLTHPFIVDTSIIYPHPRGLPLRSSLKFLANRYLKREIQKDGLNGHDSVEDARAVLDLVKLKCERGPRWGTLDANGESIFRRIARSVRPDGSGKRRETAIVEYGTPERGFGKDATYKIACTTDEEIIEGVLRAANGDEDQEQAYDASTTATAAKIPPGGADFIWGRLRDLEAVRRWNTPPAPIPTDTEIATNDTTAATATPAEQSEGERLAETASRALRQLFNLFSALPERTLLVAYSGTSDMRPALRLQQLHALYKKEFKVKKWDELSVKWTDVEEQKLRKAVDNARRGVGLLAVR